MPGFSDHFSAVAKEYGAFRPGYPAELFAWLSRLAPARGCAVDLGCGSGQAAVALAEQFDEVIGVEPSRAQLEGAAAHPRVRYVEAKAEQTGLPDGCADLAVAAQAFHWFAPEPFAREVKRLLRPRGLFAAFTYDRCRVAPEVDAVVERLYSGLVGPYWPPERRHVETGYRELPFPLPPLETPSFEIALPWTLERFAGYLGTWSAVARYRSAKGEDPIALILPALRQAWGEPQALRTVSWPLALRAGRR